MLKNLLISTYIHTSCISKYLNVNNNDFIVPCFDFETFSGILLFMSKWDSTKITMHQINE